MEIDGSSLPGAISLRSIWRLRMPGKLRPHRLAGLVIDLLHKITLATASLSKFGQV